MHTGMYIPMPDQCLVMVNVSNVKCKMAVTFYVKKKKIGLVLLWLEN